MLGRVSSVALLIALTNAFKEKEFGAEEVVTDDGIWTGYDYTDAALDIGVKNGEPYGISAEANRRIVAATALIGMEDDYASAANVVYAQKYLTKDLWQKWFPKALSVYSYDNFMKAVYKFPAFCGQVGTHGQWTTLDSVCKHEIATILAHIKHETGSLQYVQENACVDTFTDECNYTSQNTFWPPTSGQRYFGRGALQLSWNYNYGQFSAGAFYGALTDKSILLNDPGKVASDGILAFESALWFYMTPQSPKPSMHDVTTGYYNPSAYDVTTEKISQGFGATINIINGSLECLTDDGEENSNAQARIDYYTQFCTDLSVPKGWNLGCAAMGPFSDESSSVRSQYFMKGSENQCVLTSALTGYSLYTQRDYQRCVCYSWSTDLDNCITPLPSPAGAFDQISAAVLALTALVLANTL